jgi:hypothetical protein
MDKTRNEALEQKMQKGGKTIYLKLQLKKKITWLMTNKLLSYNSSQAIASSNNLITPDAMKLKLKTILAKILHSVPLSQSESLIWNLFPNNKKSYILTGNSMFFRLHPLPSSTIPN